MLNNQVLIFFIYVLSGIGISIFFDIFRVLRKTIKTSNIATYIEDIIFWIIVGLFLIWEIFNISYGELRAYIFVGLAIGSIIYILTISKYFIKINVKILNTIKNILKRIVTIINRMLKPIILQLNKGLSYIKTKCNNKISIKKHINKTKLIKNKDKNNRKKKEKKIFCRKNK